MTGIRYERITDALAADRVLIVLSLILLPVELRRLNDLNAGYWWAFAVLLIDLLFPLPPESSSQYGLFVLMSLPISLGYFLVLLFMPGNIRRASMRCRKLNHSSDKRVTFSD